MVNHLFVKGGRILLNDEQIDQGFSSDYHNLQTSLMSATNNGIKLEMNTFNLFGLDWLEKLEIFKPSNNIENKGLHFPLF